MTREDIIFGNKTFNDVLHDIYKNTTDKDRQIKLLIGELRPLIKNTGDATMIVPLIKEYLDISVRNDEHIVKVAAILQRLITGNSNGTGADASILTEDEKKQLMDEINKINVEDNKISDLSAEKIKIKSTKSE